MNEVKFIIKAQGEIYTLKGPFKFYTSLCMLNHFSIVPI